MNILNRYFSGFGANRKAPNGKFATTKNTHNITKDGAPTLIGRYSKKYLKFWFGEDYKKIVKTHSVADLDLDIVITTHTKPSYMNPKYHAAYYPSKRRKK